MTPAHKATIRGEAKRAAMTMTDYLLRNSTGRPPPPVTAADPLILIRMLAELGKWGGNWNQLAHDRNLTGQDPAVEELRLIREALLDMRGGLLKALGRGD